MKVATWNEIESVLPEIDVVAAIESAFAAYSRGDAVIPPVGEMHLEAGEVHLKYGYLRGGDHYVVKIASGFYNNAAFGLPSSNGMMLLFDQRSSTRVNLPMPAPPLRVPWQQSTWPRRFSVLALSVPAFKRVFSYSTWLA